MIRLLFLTHLMIPNKKILNPCGEQGKDSIAVRAATISAHFHGGVSDRDRQFADIIARIPIGISRIASDLIFFLNEVFNL